MGQTAVEQSAKLRDYLGKNIDTSGWAQWNQGPGAENIRQDQGPTDRRGVENAMMQLYSRGAQGKNNAEMASMAAKGLNPGSTQYGGVAKRQGDEFTDAALKAYLGSGDESRAAQNAYNQAAQQRFDMGGSVADRSQCAAAAQAQEGFALRNQPINEIIALMGGSQVTMPQFSPYQGQGINARPHRPVRQQRLQRADGAGGEYQFRHLRRRQRVAGALPWGRVGRTSPEEPRRSDLDVPANKSPDIHQ